MTRNPYRSALGALAAASASLGVLVWVFSEIALLGNYSGDPAVLAWQNLSVWLIVAGAVLLTLWLVVSALLYREPATDLQPTPEPESTGRIGA